MEELNAGRSKIKESYDELIIEIPVRKNWFTIIFIGLWICGWLFGEIMSIVSLFEIKEDIKNDFLGDNFLILWIIGWTLVGLFFLRSGLWMIFGIEIITVRNNELLIEKRTAFLYSKKTFELDKIKIFLFIQINDSNNSFVMNIMEDIWNFWNNGSIEFQYGRRNYHLGNGLDESEAFHIMDLINQKQNKKY